MEEKFLSPQEVAEMLQIKKSTVYEMIKRGDIRATKLGKQFRIARSDLYDVMGSSMTENSTGALVVCGQDQLLDTLCTLYNELSGSGVRAFRSPLGSYRGLYEMYQSSRCVATSHLWDAETDSYNLPYLPKMLPGERLAVYHLFKRQNGFYVKKGNPKNVMSFEDLVRKDLRFINRDKGSGIRIFADEMCKKMGIAHAQIYGYNEVASSHLAAATAVRRGFADVAIGDEKTCSLIEDLDFIPLKKEDYDIVFREDDLLDPDFQRLLYVIQSDQFLSEAEAIPFYDITDLGKRIM